KAPHSAELGNFLEKVRLADEEEGQSRGELVHIDACPDYVGDIRLRDGHGEGDLLLGVRPSLADVVAADVDGVVPAHVLGAVRDRVAYDPHARLDGKDPLLLGDILLEDVVLDRAGKLV